MNIEAIASPENKELLNKAINRLLKKIKTDEQLKQLTPQPDVIRELSQCDTVIEFITKAFQAYASRPFIGRRGYEIDKDEIRYLPYFYTITFAEFWHKVRLLAANLHQKKAIETGKFVAILGDGSMDWLLASFTAAYLGAPFAAIPPNRDPDTSARLINEIGACCFFCSVNKLSRFTNIYDQCPTVKFVVGIEYLDTQPFMKVAENSFPTMKDLGVWGIWDLVVEDKLLKPPQPVASTPNTLRSLFFTSGSTGVPKGSIYTDSLITNLLKGFGDLTVPSPIIMTSYLPYSHLASRFGLYKCLLQGGQINFTNSTDMSEIFNDMRLTRPTHLFLVPRVTSIIYRSFQQEVRRMTEGGLPLTEAEDKVMRQMRYTFLGDRLCSLVTGSAPTSNAIKTFMRRCFQVPFIEVYGSTETLLCTVDNHLVDLISDYKLLSVKEFGYTLEDKPHPRGELLIKTSQAIPGYFRRSAEPQSILDAEGYVHTGDIVEELSPRHLVWKDRKHFVLKLSQGEFVSLAFLESIFSTSEFIEQIFLYGSSFRSYLLAVIVPNKKAFELLGDNAVASEKGKMMSIILRREIARIGKEAQLAAYEIPRDFILELNAWTKENSLLSEAEKPARPQLTAKYSAILEKMYEGIDSGESKEAPRCPTEVGMEDKMSVELSEKGDDTVNLVIEEALHSVLGLNVADKDLSFIALSGDSLSAAQFAQSLRSKLGVELPVSFILDSKTTLAEISRRIKQQLIPSTGTEKLPTGHSIFETIHGVSPKVVYAKDLILENLLNVGVSEVSGLKAASVAKSRNILLTGAGGFLGKVLLVELLQKLSAEDSVTCLIRGRSGMQGFERLRNEFVTISNNFAGLLDELAKRKKLTVHDGDITQKHLGLDDVVYSQLCEETTDIIHNAALVNHRFNYEQLFEPNVLGTVELMRFAVRKRIKSFAFLSSVAVLSSIDRPSGAVSEDEYIGDICLSRPSGIETATETAFQKSPEGYATGYSTSKWACEILLHQLHTCYGVPVTIFRCSLLTPHRVIPKVVNATDLLSRLICGIAYTGYAPKSFYAPNFQGKKHFDGVPVDFAAKSIASIVLEAVKETAIHTYHIANTNHVDDNISLDSFLDWMSPGKGVPNALDVPNDANHMLKGILFHFDRMSNYDDWYYLFQHKLSLLSDRKKQQHSPLSILHLWKSPLQRISAKPGTDNFRKKIQVLFGEADVPYLDEEYICKYLRDLKSLNLLG